MRFREFGFILQASNLIPFLTVKEQLDLIDRLDKKKSIKSDRQELFSLLDLDKVQNHYPKALSGGERQRAAIARALYNNPSIVLADEPTGNLDSKSSDEIIALLKKSNKEYKQTIIMITHNMEIAKLADRIIKN